MSIPPRRRGSSYRSSTRRKDEERDPGAHLRCPFCRAYEVSRLYVAPTQMDACECAACGAGWDEETQTGAFRGRSRRSSVILRRRS